MSNTSILSLTQLIKVFVGFLINIALPGAFISRVVLKQQIHWVYRLGTSILIGWSLDIALGGLWMLIFGSLSNWVFPILPLTISLLIYFAYKIGKHEVININILNVVKLISRNNLIILVVLLVGIVAGILLTLNMDNPEQYFTEFYLLDENNKLPVKLNYDAENQVNLSIGVVSHEEETVEYTILVKHDQEIIDSIGPVYVDPGEMYETVFLYKVKSTLLFTQSSPLIIELDKDNQSYRILSIY